MTRAEDILATWWCADQMDLLSAEHAAGKFPAPAPPPPPPKEPRRPPRPPQPRRPSPHSRQGDLLEDA